MEEVESSKSGFSKHKKLTFWVLNQLKGEVTDLGLIFENKTSLFTPPYWISNRVNADEDDGGGGEDSGGELEEERDVQQGGDYWTRNDDVDDDDGDDDDNSD